MTIKKSTRFELLFATSVIMTFSLIIYTNYYFPTFQQIFAHKFYVATNTIYDGGDREQSHCIPSSCYRKFSIFNNTRECGYFNASIKNYTYTVSGKSYSINRKSYISSGVCNAKAKTVYYFPVYPSWSVIDKSMPYENSWKNFTFSTKIIFGLFLFCIFFIIFIKKTANKA